MSQVIWMFSGQGSQYYRMGHELFQKEPVFRQAMEQGDAIVKRLCNESLLTRIYERTLNHEEPFDQAIYTHPAIFLIEYAMAETLLKRGLKPDLLLGYSLGELTALVVAGAIPFEDAMLNVVKQAELMEYLAPPGGMLAILESPSLFEREPALFKGAEIAAHNFPRNFIITGPKQRLRDIAAVLKQREVSAVEIPVRHPFHSKAMSALEAPFNTLLARMTFAKPAIPIISAEKASRVSDSDCGRQILDGARNCVNFAQTIASLEREGSFTYVDLGPSGTMATAVKYNLQPSSNSRFISILTPFGKDLHNLEILMQKLKPS